MDLCLFKQEKEIVVVEVEMKVVRDYIELLDFYIVLKEEYYF